MTWIAIDQDQSQDEEVCGVQLGVDLIRNMNDSLDDRHSGASKHWTAQAAYSTPSNVWRSIPFVVPIYEGASTLNVALRYEAALGSESAGTPAVDVRIACNGRVGSTSTLNVTSSVASVELSVDVDPTRTWAYAAIQVRSMRGETAAGAMQPREQVTSGVLEVAENTLTPSTGRTHYELVVSRDDQLLASSEYYPSLHVTRVYDFDETPDRYWLQHWPHVSAGSTLDNVVETQNDAIDLYDLGTITPHGMAWWWSSSGSTFVSIDQWLRENGPLDAVRSSALRQLDSWARVIIRRPYVWGMGPRGDDGTTGADNGGRKIGYTAAGSSDALRIVRAMATYTDGTQGVRMAAILSPVGTAIPYGVTLTATFRSGDGTSLGTETWTSTSGPRPGIASVQPATQIGQSYASYASYLFLSRDPYMHGSGDLIGEDEYRPGTVPGDRSSAAGFFDRDIPWPSGITDGDTVYVDITVASADAPVHCLAATVIEWQ